MPGRPTVVERSRALPNSLDRGCGDVEIGGSNLSLPSFFQQLVERCQLERSDNGSVVGRSTMEAKWQKRREDWQANVASGRAARAAMQREMERTFEMYATATPIEY